MLSIFNYSEEREIAAVLVLQLNKYLPPANVSADGMAKVSVNKITRALEQLYVEAERRLKHRKMGFIRRSILANAFKWKLKETGYAAEFVDVATEGLVMAMSKRNK